MTDNFDYIVIGAGSVGCVMALMPWASGEVDHCQGIGKTGPGRVRSHLIQMAWRWVRFQPGSARSGKNQTDQDQRKYQDRTVSIWAKRLETRSDLLGRQVKWRLLRAFSTWVFPVVY